MALTELAFPISQPPITGWGYELVDTTLRTDTNNGFFMTRSRFSRKLINLKDVTWQLGDKDFLKVEEFYSTTTCSGSLPFTLNVKIESGRLLSYVVTFTEPPDITYLGIGCWEIKCSFVEERTGKGLKTESATVNSVLATTLITATANNSIGFGFSIPAVVTSSSSIAIAATVNVSEIHIAEVVVTQIASEAHMPSVIANASYDALATVEEAASISYALSPFAVGIITRVQQSNVLYQSPSSEWKTNDSTWYMGASTRTFDSIESSERWEFTGSVADVAYKNFATQINGKCILITCQVKGEGTGIGNKVALWGNYSAPNVNGPSVVLTDTFQQIYVSFVAKSTGTNYCGVYGLSPVFVSGEVLIAKEFTVREVNAFVAAKVPTISIT